MFLRWLYIILGGFRSLHVLVTTAIKHAENLLVSGDVALAW